MTESPRVQVDDNSFAGLVSSPAAYPLLWRGVLRKYLSPTLAQSISLLPGHPFTLERGCCRECSVEKLPNATARPGRVK